MAAELTLFHARFILADIHSLSVLDLTRIDLATEEDRQYQIDHWASLFSATTWEELKMLAQDNDYIKEASETVYHLTQEEKSANAVRLVRIITIVPMASTGLMPRLKKSLLKKINSFLKKTSNSLKCLPL